jgi:hypothetical protein
MKHGIFGVTKITNREPGYVRSGFLLLVISSILRINAWMIFFSDSIFKLGLHFYSSPEGHSIEIKFLEDNVSEYG